MDVPPSPEPGYGKEVKMIQKKSCGRISEGPPKEIELEGRILSSERRIACCG
jgi:hypothetical protein